MAVEYNQHTWGYGEELTPDKLNNIEGGVKATAEAVNEVNNNLNKISNVQKSVYNKVETINVTNNSAILQTINLTAGKWLLFGNAYVEVGDDRFTSYVVISGEAGYSFALAQSYEGQILKGAVKTNVNLAQCIETSKELPIYFWCVTDGNMSIYTPTFYALQLG